MTITNKDVYNWNPLDLGRLVGPRPSAYDSSPLLATIKKNVDYLKLVSAPGKFIISATDYFAQENVSYECKSLSREDLCKFVSASAAAPIFFPPVDFKGRTLVDGGLTSNYNIKDAMIEEDVQTIFLMSPTPKGNKTKKIKNILDVIADTISISMFTQLKEEAGCVMKINEIVDDVTHDLTDKYRKLNLITIVADLTYDLGFLDFDYKGSDRKQLIDYGYSYAKNIIVKELS